MTFALLIYLFNLILQSVLFRVVNMRIIGKPCNIDFLLKT